VCHGKYYIIAINNLLQISISAMLVIKASLTLLLLSHTNMFVAASRRLCPVLHLPFDLCFFEFDLLHSKKCTLTHLCAS